MATPGQDDQPPRTGRSAPWRWPNRQSHRPPVIWRAVGDFSSSVNTGSNAEPQTARHLTDVAECRRCGMQNGSESNDAGIVAAASGDKPEETSRAERAFEREGAVTQSRVPASQPSIIPANEEIVGQLGAIQSIKDRLTEMRLTDQTFDFEGAVAHTRVPVSQPLMSVFEAIANSIDAIAEARDHWQNSSPSASRRPGITRSWRQTAHGAKNFWIRNY